MLIGLYYVWCILNLLMVVLRCIELNVNYVEWFLFIDVYMYFSYWGLFF